MNKYIKGRVGVTNIIEKLKENRLRWLGHDDRRNKNKIMKKICKTKVEQNRGKR